MLAETALPADCARFTAFVSDADAWFGTRIDFARLLAHRADLILGAGPLLWGSRISTAANLPRVDSQPITCEPSSGTVEAHRVALWHGPGGADPRGLRLGGSDLSLLLKLLAVLESLKRARGAMRGEARGKSALAVDKATAGRYRPSRQYGLQRNAASMCRFPRLEPVRRRMYTRTAKRNRAGLVRPGRFSFALRSRRSNLGSGGRIVRIA